MPHSESTEVQDLLQRLFTEQFGNEASNAELLRALVPALPEHLQNYILVSGLKSQIGVFFRRKRADGLPQAPEVNRDGLHKQLDLMEVEDFRYVIEQYLKSSAAHRAQAHKLASLCFDVHGVAISVEMLEASA